VFEVVENSRKKQVSGLGKPG